jgi:antibiotic biosynthesis monooxygenase (ABM) superfamily enzyme
MFSTVRRYAGLTPTTKAALTACAADIAAVMASVPGARGSQVIASRDGVILVTVGTDEACLVESARRFRAWVDARAPEIGLVGEAEIWLGEVVLDDIWPTSR